MLDRGAFSYTLGAVRMNDTREGSAHIYDEVGSVVFVGKNGGKPSERVDKCKKGMVVLMGVLTANMTGLLVTYAPIFFHFFCPSPTTTNSF